jgi:hypothetical protein
MSLFLILNFFRSTCTMLFSNNREKWVSSSAKRMMTFKNLNSFLKLKSKGNRD